MEVIGEASPGQHSNTRKCLLLAHELAKVLTFPFVKNETLLYHPGEAVIKTEPLFIEEASGSHKSQG